MDSYIDTLEGDLERFENEISKLAENAKPIKNF